MSRIRDLLCRLPADALLARADGATEGDVRAVLAKDALDIKDLAVLLSPAADRLLEETARAGSAATST